MLENLDYIYLTMYILDLYNGLSNLFIWLVILSLISVVVLTIVGIKSLFDEDIAEDFKKLKTLKIITIATLSISSMFLVFVPSENTIKAYIGVKAVQSVGEYIDKETDIPERSKKTISNLWDKVDSYIETIDIDDVTSVDSVSNTVNNAKVSGDTELDSGEHK